MLMVDKFINEIETYFLILVAADIIIIDYKSFILLSICSYKNKKKLLKIFKTFGSKTN